MLGLVVATSLFVPRTLDYRLAWSFSTGDEPCLAACEDARDNHRLYVGAGRRGVLVLDTSGKVPKQVAAIPISKLNDDAPMAIAMSGPYLFVATGDVLRVSGAIAGLAVVDVRNPEKPSVVANWQSNGKRKGASSVVVRGDTVFLGAMREGVLAFKVDGIGLALVGNLKLNPDFPKKNPTGTAVPNLRGMCLEGNRLYVANDAGGLRVVDVSDVSKMREVGKFVNPKMGAKAVAYNGVAVRDGMAFCAVDYAGVEMIDTSGSGGWDMKRWWNPWRADAASNTWFNSAGHANNIVFGPGDTEVTVSAGDSELVTLDFASEMKVVASYGKPKDGQGAWGLCRGYDAVYATYVRSVVPFRGTWNGVRRFVRGKG